MTRSKLREQVSGPIKAFKIAERLRLLERLASVHGWVCWYCGMKVAIKGAHIDHIMPKSRGGCDDFDNLALACGPCNRAKYDRPISEFIEWLEFIRHSTKSRTLLGTDVEREVGEW